MSEIAIKKISSTSQTPSSNGDIMPSSIARNFYDVLEVDYQDKKETITKAFRRLALQRHPDKNPRDLGAVAKFQEVRSTTVPISTLAANHC